MALLKDTLITGNLRVTDTTLTDTLQADTIKVNQSSTSDTKTAGTSGQVLMTNGESAYWGTVASSDVNVTQTATTTSANYEVLLSGTADNTTRTEGARKNSNLTFNPSTGNLQTTQLNGVTVGSSPKFTDTTYSSKTAASGGTDVSLVTTGEKYTWNNKGTGTITKVGNTTSGAVTVSSANNTASFGSAVTVGSVGGVDLKFTMPANPNTNTTYTFAEGSTDGAFSVTPSGGSVTSVPVHGVVTSSNIINYTGNAKLFHGTCNTAAATVAKVVECEDFKSTDLVRGAAILVTFDVANTGAVGSLTMNVNSTGDFPIKKNYNTGVGNLTAAAEIRASTYLCTFYDKDDTKYWVISGLDYNNTYYTAGLSVYERRYIHGTDTPLYRYKICGMDATGKLVPLTITNQTSATIVSKTPTNVGFSISRGLFYYGTTTNITTTTAVTAAQILWEFAYITTPQYTFNADIATYSDVYLKGTAYGDIFTLDTTSNTSWYVQVKHGLAAASYNDVFESGAYYMYVGSSYSTANYFQISVSNPVFYFDGEQLTCPPALRYDRSNTFRVIGKGDTLLTTYHITDIIPGHTYRAWIKSWDDSGVTVRGTDYIKLSIRSYRSDDTYTGLITRYTQDTLNDYYDIIIPSDCVSLEIAGRITNGTLGEIFLEDITSIGGSSSGSVDLKDTIPQISDETLPKKELVETPLTEIDGKYLNTSNAFTDTANLIGAKTKTYLLYTNTDYYVDAYCPANTASVPVAFRRLGSPYTIIQGYDYNHPQKLMQRQKIHCTESGNTSRVHVVLFESNTNTAKVHKIQRILFLGSSWHMNTWWYLNKMFEAANIVVDIHGYYMGHSQFVEWTQLYNNDLTPLTGDEANRDARYCTSINGTNWTSHVFNDTFTSEASTLTAQQYRDAFYNDLTAGNWDIIAFQQGANQGPFWEYWSYYKDLVSILKRHAGQSCVLAFNSTWAPAIGNYRLDQFGDRTIIGQKAWQQGNYDCTRRFMAESGIHTVAPNGAMLWAMRQNSTLNISGVNDLTSDGVHPRHGLAMYGLSVCWWKTYIEPIYGIKIEDVDWLPDSSTQKVHFNGTTFQTISAAQQQLIFKCADLALSDRFGFRTI